MDKPTTHVWRRVLHKVLGPSPPFTLAVLAVLVWVSVRSWPLSGGVVGIEVIERMAYDLRMAHNANPTVDPDIVVVGFDAATETKLGQPWPPKRSVLAQAISRLSADGAKVIGLDVLLEGPTELAADQQLHTALTTATGLVIASRLDRDPDPRVRRKAWIGPYRSEDDAIDFESNAETGLTEVPVDDDGVVRRWVPEFPHLGEQLPSFALAVARSANPKARTPRPQLLTPDPVDGDLIGSAYVQFRGGAANFAQPADLADVARGEFEAGTYTNKIVLIGVTGSQIAKELGDVVVNSATARRPMLVGGAYRRDMAGVILQAHLVRATLDGDYVRPMSRPLNACLALSLGLLCLGAARRWSDVRGIAALVVIVSALALVGHFLMSPTLWMSWGSLSVVAIGLGLAQTWIERKRLRDRWSRYVSPEVFKVISDQPEAMNRRLVASVLFVDLRGFTAWSATQPPEQVLATINRYFERIVPCIMAEGGTIDKFLGDGLLAVFGAPVAQFDAPARAVRSAQAIRTSLLGFEPLGVGMAIATGELVAGHVGTRQRQEFTVIGDVVNLASRLQAEASEGEILVDEATYGSRSDEGSFRTLAVRGLADALRVWNI